VKIDVTKTIAASQSDGQDPSELFKRFFPDRDGDGEGDIPDGFNFRFSPDGGEREEMGEGSGVIMDVSGDTGYSEAFRAIGAAHGPFDLTLIKIGASDPSWQEIHMSPEEAVKTHRDLRGEMMLPVHWATFNLGFHAWRDPADRALAAARTSGVRIVLPKPGEFVEPGAERGGQVVWWHPD
jgi:L-ascorbate metabolism protein UlaG (beta-lactamase superfamily)